MAHGVIFLHNHYVFDPALGGWGNWCRQPLRCLHQSTPYYDRSLGEGFSGPPYEYWTGFPSHVSRILKPRRVYPAVSKRPGSRSDLNLSRSGEV